VTIEAMRGALNEAEMSSGQPDLASQISALSSAPRATQSRAIEDGIWSTRERSAPNLQSKNVQQMMMMPFNRKPISRVREYHL